MVLQIELWQLITVSITILGAFVGVLKLLLAQHLKHLDIYFGNQSKAIDEIKDAQKQSSAQVQDMRATIPLDYVRRDEYSQFTAMIGAKIDSLVFSICKLGGVEK